MSMRFFRRSEPPRPPEPTGNVPMIDFREGALIESLASPAVSSVVAVSPDADTVRKIQDLSTRVEEVQRHNQELERKLAVKTKDLEKKITSSSTAASSSSYPHAMMANAAAAHHIHNARLMGVAIPGATAGSASAKMMEEEVKQKLGMLETSRLPVLSVPRVGGIASRDEEDDYEDMMDRRGASGGGGGGRGGGEGGGAPPAALGASIASPLPEPVRRERIDEWIAERVRLEQLRRQRDRVMTGDGRGGGGI